MERVCKLRVLRACWRNEIVIYPRVDLWGSANVQHIDLKIPLIGRGGISEDLKSILITVWYRASEVFVHLLCRSSNLVYRSLESTFDLAGPLLDTLNNHGLLRYFTKNPGSYTYIIFDFHRGSTFGIQTVSHCKVSLFKFVCLKPSTWTFLTNFTLIHMASLRERNFKQNVVCNYHLERCVITSRVRMHN